jgi:hypothetical protein
LVKGGAEAAEGTVYLEDAAPAGGLEIFLSSDDPSAAWPRVPSIRIPAGQSGGTFAIDSAQLDEEVGVTFTAQGPVNSCQGSVLVTSVQVNTLTVSPESVVGGASATGTVTLDFAAPVGGRVVYLEGDHSAWPVEDAILIPEGQTTGTFTIETAVVTMSGIAEISAWAGETGVLVHATLGVEAMVPISLTLTAYENGAYQGDGRWVSAGWVGWGTVTLSGPAPKGGLIVTYGSSDQWIEGTITIEEGSSAGTFDLGLQGVTFPYGTYYWASANGVTVSATL